VTSWLDPKVRLDKLCKVESNLNKARVTQSAGICQRGKDHYGSASGADAMDATEQHFTDEALWPKIRKLNHEHMKSG
jgi:hypothetical protein